jgi:uncharacterized phiE125 gp8 family phage protein
MLPKLIQPPALEPVSLAEARQWLRDDGFEEDQLIQTLIVSARITVEAYTRRFLVEQKWRLSFDEWPETVPTYGKMDIPFTPCRTIERIRVYDNASTSHLLDAESFRLSGSYDGALLIFLTQPPLPGLMREGIEIDIVVGYGAQPSDTPAPLRRAILMLVAAWRENRGDTPELTLPEPILRLAAPFRRERLI